MNLGNWNCTGLIGVLLLGAPWIVGSAHAMYVVVEREQTRQATERATGSGNMVTNISTETDPLRSASEREASSAKEIHQLVNQHRKDKGLKPLELDDALSKQAREHSREMAKTEKVGHYGFQDRIKDSGIAFRSVAENVAWNFGHASPGERAFQGWLESEGHRKNIEGDFSRTGIGVWQSEKGAWFFTQLFLEPR
jgi:uncharacterized protein YkwD